MAIPAADGEDKLLRNRGCSAPPGVTRAYPDMHVEIRRRDSSDTHQHWSSVHGLDLLFGSL